MKNKRLWLLYPLVCLLLVLGFAIPASARVNAVQSFYGDLTIGGVDAPVGTVVEARGEGVLTGIEGNPITITEAGKYGGPSLLDPKLVVQGLIENGATIDFYVTNAELGLDEVKTNETALFADLEFTELNLTVPITHTLTMLVVGNGTVTPGNGTYPQGNMTINATADTGWQFANWSTANMSEIANATSPETTLTLDKNKTVTAHFSLIRPTYNLTVTSNGCCPINVTGAVNGTVPAGGNLTFTGIAEGANVTVSADDSGVCCKFDSWSDGGAQTHTITMDSNKSVTATCSVPTYNLTVNVTPGGGGNVTADGTMLSDYPNSTTWNCGDNVTLNATAADRYSFNHWSGDLSGSTNPTNIIMNSTKSVTAYFSEINVTWNLTVNVTPDGGGDIKVNDAAPDSYPYNYTFNDSELVDLNAVPASGYSFVNWTGEPIDGVTNSSTNITMNANYTIMANFAVGQYNLTISSTAGGTVTTPGEGVRGPYANGTVVDLVATADANYRFVNWTGDVGSIANVNSATTNITMYDNYTIMANFEAIPPYFTSNLSAGWNLLSTPILLDANYTSLGKIFDDESQLNISVSYSWDGTNWVLLTDNYELLPLYAIYVKVKSDTSARANFTPSQELSWPPSREVREGLNLIGPAPALEAGDFPSMALEDALVSIKEVGNVTGYTMVVSPPHNQPGWAYPPAGEGKDLLPYNGYWVVMENGPDTLYGFSTTPLE